MRPVTLRLTDPETLEIGWSDGLVSSYRVRLLREHCPCATCLEKRSVAPVPGALPVIVPAETKPLRIVKMEPQGHYAYAIHFSDGHDTGIFTLELLRELAAEDS